MSHIILGLDIGGANLKAATNAGQAATVAFPLWREPHNLARQLAELADRFPGWQELAVTMTGELCDCFATKAEGVNHILTAVQNISRSYPVRVWSTRRTLLTVDQARNAPREVASANWHALATFLAQQVPQGTGLLIDLGSTTLDVIPMLDGEPMNVGRTDLERIRAKELVYTGVKRTPVGALMPMGTVAPELFATTLDVYMVLGLIPDDANNTDTANGRPATREEAYRRLARLYCADLEEVDRGALDDLAQAVYQHQQALIQPAIQQQMQRIRELQSESLGTRRVAFLSGSGEFLIQTMLRQYTAFFTDLRSLTEIWDAARSEAAPAYAVAMLAQQRPLG